MQQEIGTLSRKLEEVLTRLQAPAAPAAPAVPAAVVNDLQADMAELTELERMSADGYETDVEKTPKQIAAATAKVGKRIFQKLQALEQQTTAAATAATGARQSIEERQQAEREQAFEQLQAEVRAVNPAVDLKAEWANAIEAARTAGYERLGAEALRLRASEMFNARVDALRTPPPAAPEPPATPAQKPTAPTRPITPQGANVRVTAPGGSPRTPATGVLSEDEIDTKHSLVK